MKTLFQFTFAALLLSSTSLFAQVEAEVSSTDPVEAPAAEKEAEEDDGISSYRFRIAYSKEYVINCLETQTNM